MKTYSTREAAKKLGLHLVTVQAYIAAGKIPAPALLRAGAGKLRIWTEEDIERVREVLPKIANGRKTRYQRLRDKQKAPAGVPVPHKKQRSKKKK
jgi:excisionase family DNA binding protein